MSGQAAELARHLARHAEHVCRYYLPKGRRCGRYWLTGDVHDTPGRSLYVRLAGPESGPGAAGHWTDAATAEHGDLIDLIADNRGLRSFREACHEARRFLSLPPAFAGAGSVPSAPRNSPEAARRLFRAGVSIIGTQAEAYLRARGITGRLDWPSLRFHAALWYRPDATAPRESWPGLLAAVTDPAGRITGVHRTWLDRARPDKAPLANPRRALGHLLGNGVRFGPAEPAPPRESGGKAGVLLAGEGIETVLSLKCVLPGMPMIAALSANHLAALEFAPMLARLYVARDRDAAGRMAAERLHARGSAEGITVRDLMPVWGDFNEDLCRLGSGILRTHLGDQLAPADVLRFLGRQDSA
jgi:Toprim domain-containing protein